MEVAGLVLGATAFAGQSISGIIKLKSYFKSYKSAPSKVKTLHNEFDALHSTLCDVQRILDTCAGEGGEISRSDLSSEHLSALRSRMERCNNDVQEWENVSKSVDINSAVGLRAFGRKLKVAANQDLFDEITSALSRHRQGVNDCLTMMNL
jgi:hypothetical protein